jgi:hypothetical protein
MKRVFGISLAVTVLAAFGLIGAVHSQGQKGEQKEEMQKVISRSRNTGDELANAAAHPGQAKPARPVRGNGITYHGGPLLGVVGQAPISVYYIW